eukprot:5594614-Amphidinium_carterae.1
MADEGPYPERVCSFIRGNPAVIAEWAPDCLVRPLSPEAVRSNDTVFFPGELQCKPITCPRDRVIRYEQLFATFYCAECGDGEIPDADQVSCSLCPLGQELDEIARPTESRTSFPACDGCVASWSTLVVVFPRQCRPCMPGTTVASE